MSTICCNISEFNSVKYDKKRRLSAVFSFSANYFVLTLVQLLLISSSSIGDLLLIINSEPS